MRRPARAGQTNQKPTASHPAAGRVRLCFGVLPGVSWSAPLVSDYGFGSSCQGSVVRDGPALLFAHPGRIGNKFNRWNISVWSSMDSGASWTAIEQVENFNATELPHLHTAYSALLAGPTDAAAYALAYERGPMPGSHIVPSQCGEYATIRWQHGAPAVVGEGAGAAAPVEVEE